jgi:hypothetical protein
MLFPDFAGFAGKRLVGFNLVLGHRNHETIDIWHGNPPCRPISTQGRFIERKSDIATTKPKFFDKAVPVASLSLVGP